MSEIRRDAAAGSVGRFGGLGGAGGELGGGPAGASWDSKINPAMMKEALGRDVPGCGFGTCFEVQA